MTDSPAPAPSVVTLGDPDGPYVPGVLTYRGDMRHALGEVKGPDTLGSVVTITRVEYDGTHSRCKCSAGVRCSHCGQRPTHIGRTQGEAPPYDVRTWCAPCAYLLAEKEATA